MLLRVVSLLEREDGGVDDASILLHCVRLWREGQDWLVVGRKAREAQLGKIVDEEIKLGGYASQTGLYQPVEGRRTPEKQGEMKRLDVKRL